MSALAIVWYFLVFLLIAGYFVLDGFDLGAGVLMPFVAKTEDDRLALQRSIGPVWDGNEVWLLAGGGALFAAFAPAYATTFSGFYLAIMLVLFGLIVRAVAVEFASRDEAWRKLWNRLFVVGSFVPALLFGVAVGNVIAGIPMNANGDYVGVPLFGLISPYTLLTGLLGLALICTQGAAWLSLKVEVGAEMRSRALRFRRLNIILSIVLLALVTVYTLALIQPASVPGMKALSAVLAVIVFIALVFALVHGNGSAAPGGEKRDLPVFLATSAACLLLVFVWACGVFPTLVPATAGDPLAFFPTPASGADITIATAASSDLALTAMLIIACIGVPLVLIYHAIVYRAFRGRIAVDDGEEY